jgi:hypothetical protein
MSCHVSEAVIGRQTRTITIENELLSATVLIDKGADIYRLEHRLTGTDVLWKTPWGVREPGSGLISSPDSEVAWLEHYEGGWQELFPNGGNACTYKGVELPFHGEASMLPWTATVLRADADQVRVRFAVRLARSPFRLERIMIVRDGEPVLTLKEQVTNEGAESLDAMWSHHPAFGAPFLSPACLIDTDARTVWADPVFNQSPGARVQPGGRWPWPHAVRPDGTSIDLRHVPESGEVMAYLSDFATGWCAVTNPTLGFGVALAWPAHVFPFAWLWQEMHNTLGFPWYGSVYTMALEPASSAPGHGLAAVIAQGGPYLTLQPGESHTTWLRVTFYDAGPGHGVQHVAADGTVRLRER